MARAVMNRLRELRARKKWSQADLANAVNVSRQAINTIENGKHDPSITLAYRISAALDVVITEAFIFSSEE
ncbi:helix-turn-helix transcriptional regulator [Hyphococcus flavus]|uniref:Helix-turn-helix transcriptional regulator n=1 Tax=Hyphococcus flavus TaxID=1866326 RepID=A0AAF0CGH2_9PROT|nr:helix-turn-helix transcriptional regulator [Hyphococcus flavus]WDI30657.1 helix-turn-helix transcriptional regulator [Hyphococcus flavus]